jgi:TetR/AcrR family tetracycline transcriptional repressor
MYWYTARVSSPKFEISIERAIGKDEAVDQGPNEMPPSWWRVENRRAAREAKREARNAHRAERAERRTVKHAAPAHAPVTPEAIADAALRIIDAQGLEGLTVRALARELGLGTMTLYWYIQNKDEVLDLVSDRMFAPVSLPGDETDWRELCRAGAKAVRAAFLAHPRAVPIIVGRGSFGPSGLQMVEYSIGLFRAAGFTEEDATDAYLAISNFVTGYCSFETAGADPTSAIAFDRASFGQMARRYVSLLPPDRYPNLTAAAPYMFGGDRDKRFEFGIDCLVAGLEARLASYGTQGRTGAAAGKGR